MWIYRKIKEIRSKFSKKLKNSWLSESVKENSKNSIDLRKKVSAFMKKKSKVDHLEKVLSERSRVSKRPRALIMVDLVVH
jgi:hypothetical protein